MRSDLQHEKLLTLLEERFPFEEFARSPQRTLNQLSLIKDNQAKSEKKKHQKWQEYADRLWRDLLSFMNTYKDDFKNEKDNYLSILISPAREKPEVYSTSQSLEQFKEIFNLKHEEDPSFNTTGAEKTKAHSPVLHSNTGIEDAVIIEDRTEEAENLNIKWSKHNGDTYVNNDIEIQIHTPLPKDAHKIKSKKNFSDIAEDAEIVSEDIPLELSSGNVLKNKNDEKLAPETSSHSSENEQAALTAGKKAKTNNKEKPPTTTSAKQPLASKTPQKSTKQPKEEPININKANGDSIKQKENAKRNDINKKKNQRHKENQNLPGSTEPAQNVNKNKKPQKTNLLRHLFSNAWKNKRNIAASFIAGGALRYIAGPAYTAIVPAVSFGRASITAAKMDYHKSLDKILAEAEIELRSNTNEEVPKNNVRLEELISINLHLKQQELTDIDSKALLLTDDYKLKENAYKAAEDVLNTIKNDVANDNDDSKKLEHDTAVEVFAKAKANFEEAKKEFGTNEQLKKNVLIGLEKINTVKEALNQKNNKKKYLSRHFWKHARNNRKNIWKKNKKQILTKTAFSAASAALGSVVANMIPEDLFNFEKGTEIIESVQENTLEEKIEDNNSIRTSDSENERILNDEILDTEDEIIENSDIENSQVPNIDERIITFLSNAKATRGDAIEDWAMKGLENYTEDTPASRTAWQILEIVSGSTDADLIKEASDIVQDLGLESDHAAMNTANSNEAYAHALKGEWDQAVENWGHSAENGHTTSIRHLNEVKDYNLGGLGERAAAYL